MVLKDRIREARNQAGLSQTELANKIGVKWQTVQKYENGIISNVPSDKIEAMAKAMDVTPAYLMGWDEEEPEDEVWELRQQLREQPGMQILFDAAKGVSKEDLEMAAEIVRRFKREAKGEE